MLQGCIYTQSGFVRNESHNPVFVGSPTGSDYTKIAARQTVETNFVYCLEIATFAGSRYYGLPQVSDGVYFDGESAIRVDAPTSTVPADAYREGGPLYDVALVYTDDGLFFESASQGLVPVLESKRCSESEITLLH